MNTVGDALKAAREKQNVSLRQIAEDTRIGIRYLENLEEGQYNQLPGGVYNRAFLRAYCECLGIDSRTLLEQYEAEVAPPAEKTSKTRAAPVKQSIFSANNAMAWSAMLILAVGGLYLSRTWIASVFSSMSGRSPSAFPIQRPYREDAAQSHRELSPLPPSPASSSETPAVSRGAFSQGQIRLEFKVTEQCWVSVNSDGNRVFVKLLEPGDDQTFAAEQFYIILGNAGGVRLNINGKPAKRMGRRGEVVRMLINEQNVQDFLGQKSER